ncbi:MAG: phospholipase D family protein [Gammaproteobacteria bacterium]|jgi:putative cardiolipin synthase|nr:phospholipase D family protein [Gammaproteobacteria bacterium]
MGMFETLVGSRVPQKYRKYFDLPERRESHKFTNTADSLLGSAARAWLAENEGPCGVYRLQLGIDALGLRLGLIEKAERSIDIQSYLIRDDLSGNLIALRLIEAANRGVRVRLLMDDALTEPIDAGLLSLNDHVNIEVRVFNPFPRRRSRLISFIANFNILNRRMHNKSFTVDNRVTIVGGRNLADEYYQTSVTSEFLDEDMAAIGPVVEDVSDGFDEYWNTKEAIPVSVFDKYVPHQALNETIEAGQRHLEKHRDSPVIRGLNEHLIRDLVDGALPWVPARTELVLDHPDKVRGLVRRQIGDVTERLIRMVSSAVKEVIVVSPYFVPQREGVDFFGALAKKGVRVVILTNSLASTNHSSVHAVYARYRKPLLRHGVELYELRPMEEGDVVGEADAARLTLHSKVAIVDRRSAFVGSFNLDPRSLYINTELGMIVESDEIGEAMASSGLESLKTVAYRLQLNQRGRLNWHYGSGGHDVVAGKEPDTSLWRRLLTRLMGLLPIEEQM